MVLIHAPSTRKSEDMKLSGWQRLWIVLSVIWLLPVAFFTVRSMPKASQYEWGRYEATRALIKKESSLAVKLTDGTIIIDVPKGVSRKELEQLHAKKIQAHSRIPMPLRPVFDPSFASLIRLNEPAETRRVSWTDPAYPVSLVKRLHNKYGKWIDFSGVESTYKNNLKQLPSEKVKIGAYAFLFWLASIALLYVLSGAIGRVVRGLREK